MDLTLMTIVSNKYFDVIIAWRKYMKFSRPQFSPSSWIALLHSFSRIQFSFANLVENQCKRFTEIFFYLLNSLINEQKWQFWGEKNWGRCLRKSSKWLATAQRRNKCDYWVCPQSHFDETKLQIKLWILLEVCAQRKNYFNLLHALTSNFSFWLILNKLCN